MRKKSLLTAALLIFISAQTSWAGDTLREQALGVITPIPPAAPELKNNPATPEKVELGKMLFFEPRLSKSCLISCNTCHNTGLGGADFQETSTGHGWQKGPRNAPTTLNSVYNLAQFWDGRAADLAEQAKGPVQAGVEMNNTPENAIKTLKSMPEYGELFKKAFPGEADPVSFDNMAKAIEAFEATLVTPNSPLDNYLRGDDKALDENEKKGLKTFIDAGCVSCHGGINMGGEDYFNFGVVEAPTAEIMAGDKGRFKVTNTEADTHVFKSPSLRNIELTPPYFHSGKVWELKEAVAIMSTAQLGTELSASEVDLLVAFLKSTTGQQPTVVHPILPAPTAATPRPVLK